MPLKAEKWELSADIGRKILDDTIEIDCYPESYS
jgi:hypothetical protein